MIVVAEFHRENLEKIFDPEFTTKADGTGVGLASCQAIVKNHHGRIEVDSTVNVGTEFFVFLPACQPGEDERTEEGCFVEMPESEPEVSGRRMDTGLPKQNGNLARRIEPSGRRVLVVDDQARVRIAAEKLLQFLGYETIGVDSGEEALDVYFERIDSTDAIDAVLLDLTLPGGLSGKEVMSEIRSVDGNAKIIATSGYFGDCNDAVTAFLNEGWNGVLPKPYTIDDLSETFSVALQN